MANMCKEKNVMPVLDPNYRRTSFEEVSLGYNEETAVNEALRSVDEMQSSQMSKVTGGMNIPGLF